MAAPTLVIADYPIGYASGFGETLFNLFDGFPRQLLWSAHPGHLRPAQGREIYQSLPFTSPQRPPWWPENFTLPYYPVLKARQAAAVFRSARRLVHAVQAHAIEHLLVIPVSPWILAAALQVLESCSQLKLALFVMDDWQGHHQAYGLPFTGWRRRLLATATDRAAVRFAVSQEMAAHYRQSTGRSWLVAHNGINVNNHGVAPATYRPPRRAVLTGDINVFRYDAVLAFGQALERYNRSHRQSLELVVLGDVASDCQQALSRLQAVKLLGRRPQAQCMNMLAQADLLYLPLAFDPLCARIARYSMPTKLPEYLASGKPILFHAPAESAIQAVARRHNLHPRIATVDPSALDSFVEAWAGCHAKIGANIAGARSALASEFDLTELRRRFQAAFA